MAFGSLRGALSAQSGNVGATNDITGSVAISVGDLVFVVFAEQTSLTASGVTDNLGNTYTAQNAGNDAGNVSGRSFYARVTVAGTLTTATISATSSAHNWAGFAAIIEGPFSSTGFLDANPANITNDVTSPFTCPSTGTLANATEVVIAWAASDGNTAWTATSPNTLAGQIVRGSSARAIIGYQAVSATTAVAPDFATGNPTVDVLGTVSFRAAIQATPSGVSGTGAVGTVTVVAASITSTTGVVGTSALGTAYFSQPVTVPVTGISGTGAVGTVDAVIGFLVYGVSATGVVNSVIAQGIFVTGVFATGQVGKVLIWETLRDTQTPGWVEINN